MQRSQYAKDNREKEFMIVPLLRRIENIQQQLSSHQPKKDKIIAALEELSGLELDSLNSSIQNIIKKHLIAINQILRQYPIKTFDNYQLISE